MSDETHVPVLLHEVLEVLKVKSGEFVVDGTINGGGHAQELFKKVGSRGTLLGIEWDTVLYETAQEKFNDARNAIIVNGNYANIESILSEKKLPKIDALLLDLGFSSAQLQSGRGFSFEKNEPLEMTYSTQSEPVWKMLRQLKEKELADIIYQFSGERYSRRIAKAIKEEIKKRSIATSGQLAEIIKKNLPRGYEQGRINPATRTFQALRIYANQELQNLERLIESLSRVMNTGGRVAVISFHSLEDKIVKEGFRNLQKDTNATIITKKPIPASGEEILKNPRARSAKLRAIQF